MRHYILLFLLGAFGITCASCFAESDGTPAITIPRVKRPPKLSDFLNGVPREAEKVVTDFRQMDPGDGDPVSQPTTAFLSYDDKNLYVAFIAKDDPNLIRARVAKRKQILDDDRITINIDASHDHLHAYWFDANPYAVQLDGITTDGYGDDFSWEGLWYSEAKITADGYVILVTIPFKTMRFPAKDVQQWGLVLGRFINRNNEFSIWPYVTRRKLPQYVGQFGHLDGIEKISPGRNIQIVPYGLASGSHYLDQPAGIPPRLVTEPNFRAGLDAKVVIKDALTLDATFNPDFSQVESDEPQVTVNQRYEVQFPEKRPFFMENASYFATPENLFFSRRIVDPEYGIRLTGKIGRWGLGVFATDDRAPGKALLKTDPSYGSKASNGVLSLQRDFFKDSDVRLFVTDTKFSGSFNRVAALDTRVHLKHNFFVTAQATTSVSRDFARRQTSGNDYYTQLSHSDRKWQYYTNYTDVSPNFQAALGYIPRTDIRQVKSRLGYKWWLEKKTLVDFGPAIIASANWDRQGRLQDRELALEWNMEFTRLTQLTYSHSAIFELYQNHEFRKNADSFIFRTGWYKCLAVQSSFAQGAAVNYYPAAGLPPLLGDSQDANVALTIRPTTRLRLDETYIYSHLRARAGWELPIGTAGGTPSVYNNHIARSKVNYQFTRQLSLRAIVDYNGVLPNESLVSLTRTKRMGYDVLLTYLLHPGTALYAGYTDVYQNLLFDPSKPPYLQLSRFPDFNTGRQVFVKLSYAFRY